MSGTPVTSLKLTVSWKTGMTADLCGKTASAERRRSNHDGWKQEEVSKHDMKLYRVWANAGTTLIARNSAMLAQSWSITRLKMLDGALE